MVASTKVFIQEILLFCMLGLGMQAAAAINPADLPDPPPLPPSLKNEKLPPPPDLPDPSELNSQLQQLGELLNMAPDKLSKLRQTIEVIEKMSPVEREAMRIRISQITQSTPQLTREVQQMANRHPGISRNDLSQFWLAASEEERNSIRDNLSTLGPEKQSELLADKVSAFIKRRDAVFEAMQRSLEEKRKSLPESTQNTP